MEYLSRGGRIGIATKFLGSLLQIKPLIYVDPETGTVGASIPGRSGASAIEGLYKQFFKYIDTKSPMHITVLHNAALEEAQALAERVRQEFAPQELFISIVSPALGVHTGPRAITVTPGDPADLPSIALYALLLHEIYSSFVLQAAQR